MDTIKASVGENGENRKEDVTLVQTLLKAKKLYLSDIDGDCGSITIAAIRAFQATFLSSPDGLIEPGKTTWQKLCAGAAPQDDWSGDSSLWSQDKKLQSLHPQLRPKVTAVLAALQQRDFKAQVFYGWRSVKVQLDLFNKGNSKLKFSFHNAQKPDGTPNSYAADIVDSRYGWDPQAETSGFWKALGEEAKKQSLIWGGDWKTFPDVAHVQLVENGKLQQVKEASGL